VLSASSRECIWLSVELEDLCILCVKTYRAK
jgi:hypothetical protein